MMDITSTFDFFIDMFVSGFRTCYSLLDRIQFHGVSLLDFMLWILALSIILPLLLTLLSSGQNGAELSARAVSEGARSAKGKFDSAFYSWSTRASRRY